MNESKNDKTSFLRDIIGCLVFPQNSFKSILKKPDLKKATVLILIIAIFAGWASYNYGAKLPLPDLSQLPGQPSVGAGQFTQMIMIMSAILAVIGVFVFWLISSTLIHVFSRFLGGKGSFRSMLTLAGYASTPLIIQHVLRLVDSFLVSKEELQLTTNLQISTFPLLNSIVNAAVNFFTIFGLWSIILLIFATHDNYKISRVKSTLIIIVSFVILVFISTFLPFI